MIKYFCLFLFVLPICNAFSADNKRFELFLKTLAIVESSNNPGAIGDNGKAIGIYQIHKSYFLDAQKYNKSLNKYKYKDCFDKNVSEKIVLAYMNKYCKMGSIEDMARTHNGGPSKRGTDKYWKNFQKHLAK